MVTLGPDSQTVNYTHMSSFVDLHGSPKPSLCVNKNSMYDFLVTNGNFKKFLKLAEKADRLGYINGLQARYTMFIPPDKFLNNLPDEYFDNLDMGTAREIFNSLTLSRRIDAKLLTSSPVSYLTTLNPEMRMYVTNISGYTRINNCVNVIRYNVIATNGIMHIVDGLISPSEDTFMN